MKQFYLIFSLLSFSIYAQEKRISPKVSLSDSIEGIPIELTYGQPSVKGRVIFGDLVPYDKIWRTGANEATVFENKKALKIGGETLPPDKYSLFTIPGREEWVVIFNDIHNQWGAYNYDSSKDVLRIKVPVEKTENIVEKLNFYFDEKALIMEWERSRIVLPINNVN
jgi:hypothetical protein